MNQSTVDRPIRLWFVTIMNILLGALILSTVVFFAPYWFPPFPGLGPSPFWYFSNVLISIFLVVSSVLALFRFRYARGLILVAVIFFYGILAIPGLIRAIHSSNEAGTLNWVYPLFIDLLLILVNAWGLYSTRTNAFFERERTTPKSKVLSSMGPE